MPFAAANHGGTPELGKHSRTRVPVTRRDYPSCSLFWPVESKKIAAQPSSMPRRCNFCVHALRQLFLDGTPHSMSAVQIQVKFQHVDARSRATRGTWNSAFAGVMCGSSPEAEVVT